MAYNNQKNYSFNTQQNFISEKEQWLQFNLLKKMVEDGVQMKIINRYTHLSESAIKRYIHENLEKNVVHH